MLVPSPPVEYNFCDVNIQNQRGTKYIFIWVREKPKSQISCTWQGHVPGWLNNWCENLGILTSNSTFFLSQRERDFLSYFSFFLCFSFFFFFPFWLTALVGFPGGSEDKASAYNAGDPGSIPGSGRSPGEGNGNPLQYSCLENPMDWEAW